MPKRLLLLMLMLVPGLASSASGVILVRHADKSAEGGADPALSRDGELRAQALAEALADAGVETILVTPFRRTRDTAAPLAVRLGASPRVVEVAAGGTAHVDAVAAAVRDAPGVVLVVGHSNTVPAIVRALGGPELPDICEARYDNVFVMTLAGPSPTLQRWRYGAPSPPPGEGCL
ncbi:SixA phosphatase family protein [Pseudomarimonas salicorniae]|uniref:Histidine phosphatase family protein n=1 Tax=Pseudomarimonas salicorniae TaxID=2933270 RepID=A0ABT0GLP4_9GAMM|nr:phosphoglycerate mutase family protein [Lysobacter sp. CAU 1642]MCK7594957.1 histidine phosphatase family protein [Lysobacter sp. CAU 1642]